MRHIKFRKTPKCFLESNFVTVGVFHLSHFHERAKWHIWLVIRSWSWTATIRFCKITMTSDRRNLHSTLQRNTRGFNATSSRWIRSVSVVQFTVQMSKLNGLGKTHRKRIFVVGLKFWLRSPFHYEPIVLENSDTKRINQILHFHFLGTFCERLILIADGF